MQECEECGVPVSFNVTSEPCVSTDIMSHVSLGFFNYTASALAVLGPWEECNK